MTSWPTELNLRGITRWPSRRTPEEDRRRSAFRAGLSDTLSLLRRELALIDATDVWLEVAIPGDPVSNPVQWRQDGQPRATATLDHPGVVVSFRSHVADGREVRVGTDRFLDWRDNLRAIAFTLEHQRGFERYGTATRGEAYTGWAQLPSGGGDPDPGRGRRLIQEHGSVAAALKATHPDHGGDPADFADVQAARDA